MAEPYPQLLAGLAPDGFLIPETPRLVCLLTGQSSFTSSALPPDKRDFLAAIAPAGWAVLGEGFPWHRRLSPPGPVPGLLAASLRNARQWLWARHHQAYRQILGHILGRLLDGRERLLLVTGSCGIDLLAAGLATLPPPPAARIDLVALGPAGRMPPPGWCARTLILQGRGDGWSRALWRGPVDHRPGCGHLDYYTDTETIDLVRRFAAEVP